MKSFVVLSILLFLVVVSGKFFFFVQIFSVCGKKNEQHEDCIESVVKMAVAYLPKLYFIGYSRRKGYSNHMNMRGLECYVKTMLEFFEYECTVYLQRNILTFFTEACSNNSKFLRLFF